MISLGGILACMLIGSWIGTHIRSARWVMYMIAGFLAVAQTALVLYDLYTLAMPDPLM